MLVDIDTAILMAARETMKNCSCWPRKSKGSLNEERTSYFFLPVLGWCAGRGRELTLSSSRVVSSIWELLAFKLPAPSWLITAGRTAAVVVLMLLHEDHPGTNPAILPISFMCVKSVGLLYTRQGHFSLLFFASASYVCVEKRLYPPSPRLHPPDYFAGVQIE